MQSECLKYIFITLETYLKTLIKTVIEILWLVSRIQWQFLGPKIAKNGSSVRLEMPTIPQREIRPRGILIRYQTAFSVDLGLKKSL